MCVCLSIKGSQASCPKELKLGMENHINPSRRYEEIFRSDIGDSRGGGDLHFFRFSGHYPFDEVSIGNSVHGSTIQFLTSGYILLTCSIDMSTYLKGQIRDTLRILTIAGSNPLGTLNLSLSQAWSCQPSKIGLWLKPWASKLVSQLRYPSHFLRNILKFILLLLFGGQTTTFFNCLFEAEKC